MKKRCIGILTIGALVFMGCDRIQEKLKQKSPAKQRTETVSPFLTRLENGMNVWLQENHANPMISVIVVIGVGSRNESWEINGASHMLEHLLFNGTERRTQAQLYEEMEFSGGYFNATTRRDHTAFIVLIDKNQLEKGLDILSDMLFRSILPEEKFQKEKGIVIEEIGKDKDRTEETAARLFQQTFYRSTPYAMSVTGTPVSISNLTREQIEFYYKTYYVPNNMTTLVIGDFQKKPMMELLEKYFGAYQTQEIPEAVFKTEEISADDLNLQPANTERVYLNLGVRTPLPSREDFFEMYLFNRWISSGDPSLLKRRLNAGREITFYDVTSELVFSDNESSIQISVTTDPQVDPKKAVELIKKEMKKLSHERMGEGVFQSLLISLEAEEIYLSEKLHYYGLSLAPRVAAGGMSFGSNWLKNLSRVKPDGIPKTASRWITDSLFISTAVIPFPAATDSSVRSRAKMTRAKLQNGLTLLIDENQDSRVFAIHVLAMNRSMAEPAGKSGIADVLHQMLKYGTQKYDTGEWQEKLKSIGANMKVGDDPTIPYDDFYTTPECSWVRMETIDTYFEEGIRYLSQMIQTPRFREDILEKVKKEQINRIRSGRESARETNRRLYHEVLFANSAWSKPVEGTEESIQNLTLRDLEDFHSQYFAPNNLIYSVVTNVPTQEVLNVLRKYNDQKSVPLALDRIPVPITDSIVEKRIPIGKPQSSISWGYTFHLDSSDFAACEILNSLVSGQLSFHLREEKGLAYSLGSSMNFPDKMGWFTVTLGTRPQNIQASLEGIKQEIAGFRDFPFSEAGVQKAKNSLIGRLLMRRLSRINAAYYYGLYEFQGFGYDYFRRHLDDLRNVTSEDVRRAAKKYLQVRNYVITVAE